MRELAEELGAAGCFAEPIPVGKAKLFEQLTHEGRRGCFVGDGINDAIALKKAHLSISIAGASTFAVDTAGIVLMDPSLDGLVRLFGLAKEMQENLD